MHEMLLNWNFSLDDEDVLIFVQFELEGNSLMS